MIESVLARGDRVFRIPRWAWLPALLGLGDLAVAGFGFYWDVSWHIEKGRDEFLFTVPHDLILLGLMGVGVLGLLAQWLYRRSGEAWGIRVWRWRVAPGAALLVACGVFAAAGFPLDDVWHRMFGVDVTLWGPTHMLMVSGAALSPLGFAMLLAQGIRQRAEPPARPVRILSLGVASAMLVGVSAYQGEFDFGVPQFQLLFQPLLVAAAAGLVLVTVRLVLGRGAAILTVLLHLAERGAIAAGLAAAGRGITRFPLYLGAAVMVGAVAFPLRGRPWARAAAAGIAVGTLGVLAEAGVLAAWGKHPWSGHVLAWGIGLGVVVGLGASAFAVAIAGALRPGLPTVRPALAVLAGLAVLGPMEVAFPRLAGEPPTVTARFDPASAVRSVTPVHVVFATPSVRVDPPSAAEGADWFEVMSWQGGGQVIARLHPTGPGRYSADRSVPLGGSWKTLVRLARGDQIVAMPLYLPVDREANSPPVLPKPTMRAGMRLDSELLLREARDAPAWASPVGYSVVGGVGVLWLVVVVVTLARLQGSGVETGGRAESPVSPEPRVA